VNDEPLIRRATLAEVERVWRERWGLPVVTVRGQYLPGDVEGLVAVDREGALLGLVTWAGDELVSLDALVQGEGYGSRLLAAAERAIFATGAGQVVLITTNDNLRALGFYLRRGYRLVRVHLDAMDRVRMIKPGVPSHGDDGIQLRDMWELLKEG
jgi:GNAT superfamily N-acetyltransferase